MLKRKYTKEFKIEALNLAKELGSYSEAARQAARQLGIRDSILHGWKDKYGISISDKSGKTVAQSVKESDEVRELKKKIQELEKTNYILKRAAAFFSQDHLK